MLAKADEIWIILDTSDTWREATVQELHTLMRWFSDC